MAFLRKPGKRFFLAAVMVSVLLSGCRPKLSIVSEITEEKAYTMPQSMIILTTERNRYQQIYTGQVWGVKLPGNQNFETYLVNQVQEFLEEMKLLNLLAESRGVAFPIWGSVKKMSGSCTGHTALRAGRWRS